MDVLVSGTDSELGHAVAAAFAAAGHRLVIAGTRHDDLSRLADELGAGLVLCDSTDPASLAAAQTGFPHHLDTVVVVPALDGRADQRSATLADTAAAWRSAFDHTVLSAVLTVQTVSEHLRSGGSIVSVLQACDGNAAAAAAKAALSEWTAAQADHFGIRGITINTVAAGRPALPGYDGLTETPAPVAAEIARMAVFLATPAARHITGQTLHVGRGVPVSFA